MNALKIAPELLSAFQDYKSEGRVNFSAHSISPPIMDVSPAKVQLPEFWTGSDQVAVVIQSPSGDWTGYQEVIQGSVYWVTYDLSDTRIHIATPGVNPENQDYQIQIAVRSHSDGGVTPGIWKLLLRGRDVSSGRVDVLVIDGQNPPQVLFTEGNVSNSLKIGSPGTAHRAITEPILLKIGG